MGGALLFAASTDQAFTSVVLSVPLSPRALPSHRFGTICWHGPLTGTAGNEITGVEGSSTGTVLLGTFVDANQTSTAADYTTPPGSVVVNWGDGSAPQTLAASNLTPIGTPNGVVWTINAAHTYTEEGTYAYTVTVTDVDGAATIVAGSAIIADAALTAGHADAARAQHRRSRCPAPRSSAPSPTPTRSPRPPTSRPPSTGATARPTTTGIVVATATPGVFDVEGGHTYAKAGVFTTKVTVVDDGGSTVVVPGTAAVTDLPVTGTDQQLHRDRGPDTGHVRAGDVRRPQHPGHGEQRQRHPRRRRLGRRYADRRGRPAHHPAGRRRSRPTSSRFSRSLAPTPTPRRRPQACPTPLSVIVTTLGGATTTLTSPPGGGVTVLDAGLTGSEGGEITGVRGRPDAGQLSCSGPSSTPTRRATTPPPTTPPRPARSWSTGATARRHKP